MRAISRLSRVLVNGPDKLGQIKVFRRLERTSISHLSATDAAAAIKGALLRPVRDSPRTVKPPCHTGK